MRAFGSGGEHYGRLVRPESVRREEAVTRVSKCALDLRNIAVGLERDWVPDHYSTTLVLGCARLICGVRGIGNAHYQLEQAAKVRTPANLIPLLHDIARELKARLAFPPPDMETET